MAKSKDSRRPDLTVTVAGITFRSPVLPAASELVIDGSSAERVAATGIFEKVHQGIAAWMKRKGYASISEFRGKVLSKIIPTVELRKKEIAPHSLPPETPYRPKIDRKKCRPCRACERACFYQVFHFDPEKKCMTADKDRCWSCGLCVGICPEGAIRLVDKSTGKTVWNGKGVAAPFSMILEG